MTPFEIFVTVYAAITAAAIIILNVLYSRVIKICFYLSEELDALKKAHNALGCAKLAQMGAESQNELKIMATEVELNSVPTEVLNKLMVKLAKEGNYEAAAAIRNEINSRQRDPSV
jgi:excinuclease UvrABC helicase subunit UvrB